MTEYKLLEQITKGGGGEIYHVEPISIELQSKKPIVAKKLLGVKVDAFIQEVSIMAMFADHPNFAKLIGYNMEQTIIFMVYYPNGSLQYRLY